MIYNYYIVIMNNYYKLWTMIYDLQFEIQARFTKITSYNIYIIENRCENLKQNFILA